MKRHEFCKREEKQNQHKNKSKKNPQKLDSYSK